MSTHRLMVSYPVDGQFGANKMRDEAFEVIVGGYCNDAGSGFGMRDMGWMFEDAEDEAYEARDRLLELYPESTGVTISIANMEDV